MSMDGQTHKSQRATRLHGNPWTIFIVVGLGSFLGPLSGSIVNVALPSIGVFFGTDVQSTKWVVLVYLMVATFLLPMAGKWGQRYGEGRLYTSGLAVYVLGSILCALTAYSPYRDLLMLVGARAVQACGSSLMFATGGALVAKYIPVERRGIAFGLVGSIVAMALISGPVLGGVICAFSSWEWVFWLLVPVAITGFVASILVLPPEGPERVEFRLPIWSSAAWSVLVIAITLIGEAFSKGLWVHFLWFTTLVVCAALLWFVQAEKRGPSLFDYSMFSITTFRMAAQGAVMVNVIVFVLTLLMPFYLDVYLEMSQIHIGLLLGMAPLCSFFFGPIAGHIADKTGYRLPIIAGLVTMVVGYALLVLATANESQLYLAVGFGLLGAGSGMYGGPNFAAMMSSVLPTQRPLASSFGSLTRNIGFLAGTSLGSIALGLYLAHYGRVHHVSHNLMQAARNEVLSPQSVPEDAFVYAFSHVLLLCAIGCILVLLASLRFPNRPAPLTTEPVVTVELG